MTIYLFGSPSAPAVHQTTDPRMIEVLLLDGFVMAEVGHSGDWIMPTETGGEAALATDEAGA